MSAGEAAIKIARRITAGIDALINFLILVLLLFMFACGFYALWDTQQIYYAASGAHYEIYKPTADNTISFDELRAVNPEVIGWISVYGTNIDYPLVHSSDSMKYVNTAADGSYSLSGAIFLDSMCPDDFSSYSAVIHGHNMSADVMFGQLKNFRQKDYFDQHRFGNLYFNGRDHGLIIFEYLQADAYDFDVYDVSVKGEEEQTAFLNLLDEKAIQYRDVGQNEADQIVLLSTCALGFTNARDVLACVITDETFEDTLQTEKEENSLFDFSRFNQSSKKGLPLWIISLLILCITISVYIIYKNYTVKHSYRKTETVISDDI